jgi:hypothetical protein
MGRLSSSVVLTLAMTALPAAAKGVKGAHSSNKCLVPTFYEAYSVVGILRETDDTAPGHTTFPEYTEIPFGENARYHVGQASGQFFTLMTDADLGGGYITFACVHKRTKTDYEGLCTSTTNDGEEGPIYTVSVASTLNSLRWMWLSVPLSYNCLSSFLDWQMVLSVNKETCMVEGSHSSGRDLAGPDSDTVFTFYSTSTAVK